MLYVWLMVASVWAGLASPLGLQPAPDWILEDEEPPMPARRITPKSVFVAPTFSECDSGYRHDPVAGRCVRIVKVNQKAQWDFFLSRLNAMYAQPTKQKAQSGPLHLALPLDPITTSTTARSPTTTTRPPTTTTSPPPTTTGETSPPSTITTVPASTSTPPPTTITSTLQPTTITTEATTTQPQTSTMTQSPTTTTDQPSTTTLIPSTSTISSTFPSTPPTTYFTEPSLDTTFPFSTTESSFDFSDGSTFPSSTFSPFSTDPTESHTDYSTFPEPLSVPSDHQRIYHRATVKPKPKCPPNVRQLGEYDSGDNLDCETETIRPHIVRFPSATTFPPRRKMGYIRFPDRTWQSSYWWPRSSWNQQHVPLPSSYQKIQHYPAWHRGRSAWSDSPSI